MLVKDIMSASPASICHNVHLHHAAELVALSGLNELMVLDDQSNFIGVLSEADILRTAMPDIDEILAQGGSLADGFEIFLRKGEALADRPIMPLVKTDPIVLSPDDHVAAAAVILLDNLLGCLPVVASGKLVGTVSRGDVCRAVIGVAQGVE